MVRLTLGTICPLLSNGSRLFFCSSHGEAASQASINGGESALLTLRTQGYECLLDINHERNEFLVCRFANHPFWRTSGGACGGDVAKAFGQSDFS
jgi:hypothetical protein